MSERISSKEVAHVAYLARLNLTDDELNLFTEQLEAVLSHASDIEALDLSGIEPMSHPLPVENIMRKDKPQPSLEPREFLSAAPAVEDGRFVVPKILDEEL